MAELFVFPDTNVFLHYQGLDQIEWPALLHADAVVLVIAPIVIRELNKKKDFPGSAKVRERAAAALKKLDQWAEQALPVMIRASVKLQFRVTEPLIDFAEEHLSRDISDDHLIASMIEFRSEHSEYDLALVTQDIGLKLKSKAHSIRPVQLPDTVRLPEELDASEKRIRELEQENRRLRDRIPAPKLQFANGSDRVVLSLQQPESLTPEAIASKMAEIRAEYKRVEAVPTTQVLGVELFRIPENEVNEYNAALERFYADYERYVPTLQEFHNVQQRTHELRINLSNEGTCPAEDVDVFMHFPDGFQVLDEDHLPKMPEGPKPPARPMTLPEKMAAPLAYVCVGYVAAFPVNSAGLKCRTSQNSAYEEL